jgi:hypothetical protein
MFGTSQMLCVVFESGFIPVGRNRPSFCEYHRDDSKSWTENPRDSRPGGFFDRPTEKPALHANTNPDLWLLGLQGTIDIAEPPDR